MLSSHYRTLRMSSYNLLPHYQISVNNEAQTLLWWEGNFCRILVAIDHITQEKINISACVNGIPYINGAREIGVHKRIASVM